MIAAGLQLMVLGMTIVFVFLILLVFLMNVTTFVTRRFIDRPGGTPATGGAGATAGGSPGAGPSAASAIGAAPGAAHATTHTDIPAVLAAVAAHRARAGRSKA